MIKNEIKNIITENLNKAFEEYDKYIRQNLIEVSLNSLKKNIDKLQKALKEKNKEEILFITHTIKGIFLNTRCFDLSEEFNDSKLKSLSLDEIITKLTLSLKKII